MNPPRAARTSVAAALLAGLVTTLGLTRIDARAPAAPPREPVEHTAIIDATSFRPAVLAARPGDTVIWKNDDLLPHTVTSTVGDFDSGAIAPGGAWRHTIGRQHGDLPYVCVYHPTMKAVVRVP